MQLLEERQAVRVGEILQHHCVVEVLVRKPVVSSRLQARAAEFGLAVRKERGTARQVRPARIRCAQPRDEAAEELRERERVLPRRDRLASPIGIVRGGKEFDRALMSDEGGERLVELSVAREVDCAVEEFVEDDLRQRNAIEGYLGGEERVVEPA